VSFECRVCRGFCARAIFKSSSRVARRQCDTPVQLHIRRYLQSRDQRFCQADLGRFVSQLPMSDSDVSSSVVLLRFTTTYVLSSYRNYLELHVGLDNDECHDSWFSCLDNTSPVHDEVISVSSVDPRKFCTPFMSSVHTRCL
jgi:hypothetical protein